MLAGSAGTKTVWTASSRTSRVCRAVWETTSISPTTTQTNSSKSPKSWPGTSNTSWMTREYRFPGCYHKTLQICICGQIRQYSTSTSSVLQGQNALWCSLPFHAIRFHFMQPRAQWRGSGLRPTATASVMAYLRLGCMKKYASCQNIINSWFW